MMKSLVKDPSSLSAEDVKAVVNSKPFQNVLNSDDFDSMLPDGVTLKKVKTFINGQKFQDYHCTGEGWPIR